MKFAAVVLALATSVLGQSLADLPSCSVTCLTTAVSSSGCGVTDYSCQCGSKKDAIVASVTPCLQSACSAADQAKVLSITESICASVAGGSASASGAASSAVSSAAASASKAVSSAAASASKAATSSAPATQSSSAAGGRLGAAGALIAGAAVLAL